MIDQIKLERFTAFEQFTLKFSPGLNLFIGENGCGKTHLLKVIYAASDVSKGQKSFAEKLNRVFLPSGEQIGRLVKRRSVSTTGSVEVTICETYWCTSSGIPGCISGPNEWRALWISRFVTYAC